MSGVPFMFDSLNSVSDQSVHFAKFLILEFSQGYPVSTNFMESVVMGGGERHTGYFSGNLPNIKILLHFDDKSTSATLPLAVNQSSIDRSLFNCEHVVHVY